jgi:2-dehydro-3-deoxy-D-arabinonate dehydratase
MLRLFHTSAGPVLERDDALFPIAATWDELVNAADLTSRLVEEARRGQPIAREVFERFTLRPPIEHQEVWAAGVTYYRSRTARMEESKAAGGGDFYDRVYGAERPELFFKATPRRVVAPDANVSIRGDSRWSVPEPELALVVDRDGRIVGYTIGNDMSARDIEGENPLYLPQAKVYRESCALGPCVLVSRDGLPSDTTITLKVTRDGGEAYAGETSLQSLKRDPDELVGFLYRDNDFPDGCVLLTGTGIVPPDDFTLKSGDLIEITIPPIGTLRNVVR